MSVDLKSCPFCGGEAEIERVGTPRYSTIYTCTDCACRLETGEEWDHGKDWNTRTPDPAVAVLEAEVARLRGWLRDLDPHLEALICYASTMGEHPLNRTVSEILEYLADLYPAPSEKEAG